jgi:hypothetical protein
MLSKATFGSTGSAAAALTPVTYRLVPKDQASAASLMPVEPAAIVDHVPDPDRGSLSGGRKWKEVVSAKKALKDSVTAEWSLRLAAGG